MSFYAYLPDRAVLAVYGEDAREFLQGLVSNDVRDIASHHAVFAALLSPQGRFLHDFFISFQQEQFWLETDKARLPDLAKRLSMYRLRSKVTIEPLPQMQVAALWGQDVRDGYADARLSELGNRVVFEASPAFAGMSGDYERHRLSLGVPEGAKDLIADRSILLEYGYDELGGVDFAKGCYVGQEVTARSKHRASLRKFIHQVEGQAPLAPAGTPVLAGAREAGVMASSSGGIGLAHLKVEEVTRAARENVALVAGGVMLTAKLPQWCKTAFADAAITQ